MSGEDGKSAMDKNADRAERIPEETRRVMQADHIANIAEAQRELANLEAEKRREDLIDRRQTRRWRNFVLVIAAAVPLLILGLLYWMIRCEILMRLGDWAQVVFISGSFIAFIAGYGFLLSGLFRRHSQKGEKDSPATMREMLGKTAGALSRVWSE